VVETSRLTKYVVGCIGSQELNESTRKEFGEVCGTQGGKRERVCHLVLELNLIRQMRRWEKKWFLHHKLHGSQFDNNSRAKFAFHRFVWNRHGCRSSTCIIWTLMSCAFFIHECHMPVCIVLAWMLCVYS